MCCSSSSLFAYPIYGSFPIICVSDESEAIASLEIVLNRLDFVVCDYQLFNGRSGVNVIGTLRQYCGYELPAILVSGASTPEELLKIESSDLPCLTKSVSPEVLRQAITAQVQDSFRFKNDDAELT